MPFIHTPTTDVMLVFSFCVQKMEVELNAEREKLLADKMLVESELKTVNKDLTTQLTTAKSQVDNYNKRLCYCRGPRDALRQLKYYGRFLTELLTRSSANPEEPCEHTVS